jgi:hypothetical protein
MAGTALAVGGFIGLAQVHAHSGYVTHVLLPACVVSLALGLLFTPLAAAATADVHYTQAGLASGVLNTSRQVGGSIALAALATVATDRTHSILSGHRGASTAAALSSGYSRAFLIAAALSAGALLASWIVPPLRSRQAAAPVSEQAGSALAADPA